MKLLKRLENMFAASAFAEAGEFETARQLASEETAARRGKGAAVEDKTRKRKQGSGIKPSSTGV